MQNLPLHIDQIVHEYDYYFEGKVIYTFPNFYSLCNLLALPDGKLFFQDYGGITYIIKDQVLIEKKLSPYQYVILLSNGRIACYDKTFIILDPETLKVKIDFTGHNPNLADGIMTDIKDSDLILTWSIDNNLILWNTITGDIVNKFDIFDGNIFKISQISNTDVAVLYKNKCDIWNFTTGVLKYQFKDSNYRTDMSGNLFATAKGILQFWNNSKWHSLTDERIIEGQECFLVGDRVIILGLRELQTWDFNKKILINYYNSDYDLKNTLRFLPDNRICVATQHHIYILNIENTGNFIQDFTIAVNLKEFITLKGKIVAVSHFLNSSVLRIWK